LTETATQPETAVTVLLIDSLEEDRLKLGQILRNSNWKLRWAASCQQAIEILQQTPAPVVICERDLPDGTWREVLEETHFLAEAPLLIVASRFADDFLWAEVLNLGGWDVLAKPLEAKEVIWSVSLAWREWNRRLCHSTEVKLLVAD